VEFLTEFQTVWNDPQARHALLVHWPVVLAALTGITAVALAVRLGNSSPLRWCALLMASGLLVSSVAASWSGDNAEATVTGALSSQGDKLLEKHEEMGEALWMFAAGSLALVALSFVRRKPVRKIASIAAAVVGLITAGWATNTGHLGGMLVYQFGAVGSKKAMPTSPASLDHSDPRLALFREVVLPVFAEKCWRCHNPERMVRSGNLDQTTMGGMLAGGDSGPALVPGSAEKSLIVEAIRWTDPEFQMPPKEKLSPEQIAAIEQWINEGAVWDVKPVDVPTQ